ncbi:hypothetical protein C0989_010528 [Termitomyces sp. Mn162]|nr:hypothetical protein C0989_010528 [Termitomyces sp. Mn162]
MHPTASVNNSSVTCACSTLWFSRTMWITPGTELGLEEQAGGMEFEWQSCSDLQTWGEPLEESPVAEDTPVNINQSSLEHRNLTLMLMLIEYCIHPPLVLPLINSFQHLS